MVINLDTNFKKGREQFKQRNYKKALGYFDGIPETSDDYEYSLVYRISCLIELKQYGEALAIVNPLISRNPHDELLWFDKVTCHIFLKEDEEAFKALDEVERIVDRQDERRLLIVAKFYNMLGDNDKALRYCDEALSIDGNYREALLEKSYVAIRLDDHEMIEEIADRLLEISSNDVLSLTPIFMLKLFSKNFRGCLDMIENSVDDEVKDETILMFKSIIFKELSEDLNAQIMLSGEIDLSVDDALEIMFGFKENGFDNGEIHGVKYIII